MSNKVTLSKENQTFVLERKRVECERTRELEANTTAGERCHSTWDQVACWPSTEAGHTATMRCPDYIDNFLFDANATKKCEPNGSWFVNPVTNKEWTNYTQCINRQSTTDMFYFKSHVQPLRYISLVGYSLSLVALLLAIFIMIKFRKLRCARNTLHLNLFASFVWRAVVSLCKSFMLVDGTQFFDSIVFGSVGADSQSWYCRVFAMVFNFGMVSNYSWIFVEGTYLHTLIFAAFFSEDSGVYGFVLFGWVFPLVCVLSWAVVRATLENTECWLIHPNKWSTWIIKGPLLVTVLLNFFFFVNIIRVLFTKLQSANSIDSRKHRHMKLAKSSLVLIPLFGIPYVVFLALNENVCPTMELLKLYFEMIFNSFNGFIVACLYCFLNGEVKAEVSKKWRRTKVRMTLREMSQRKTTMTRSVNSNVNCACQSNSYDTTAIQDDDDTKNNCSSAIRIHNQNSGSYNNNNNNALEMKAIGEIPSKEEGGSSLDQSRCMAEGYMEGYIEEGYMEEGYMEEGVSRAERSKSPDGATTPGKCFHGGSREMKQLIPKNLNGEERTSVDRNSERSFRAFNRKSGNFDRAGGDDDREASRTRSEEMDPIIGEDTVSAGDNSTWDLIDGCKETFPASVGVI